MQYSTELPSSLLQQIVNRVGADTIRNTMLVSLSRSNPEINEPNAPRWKSSSKKASARSNQQSQTQTQKMARYFVLRTPTTKTLRRYHRLSCDPIIKSGDLFEVY